MSTEIKDNKAGSSRTFGLHRRNDASVRVSVGMIDAHVRTADLLAAIEAEGIGTVVEGTLPTVTVAGARLVVRASSWPIEYSRKYRDVTVEQVAESLAILRWLDANPATPPVDEADEADVEALAFEIRKADRLTTDTLDAGEDTALARFLLASGRVTVTR